MSAPPTNKDGLPYIDFETIRIVIIHDQLPTHDKTKCADYKKVDKLGKDGKPITKKDKKGNVIKDKKGNPVTEKEFAKEPTLCSGITDYKTRKVESIRSIIIHHHAGSYKKTTEKVDGLPKACIATAEFFIAPDNPHVEGSQGRHWPGYAYHYDVPYFDDIEDGKRVVYLTQRPDLIGYHTGRPNDVGISISMIGHLRSVEAPDGAKYSKNKGLPSEHQQAVIPVLVKYLQDKKVGYSIANCHVQGHFQHGKIACPGFDFEKWIMEYEDEPRRKGQGFCYPVDLDGGKSPPYLKPAAEEKSRFKKYVLNTHEGGSGYHPFGRRHPWHNGIHLFPSGGAGSPAYAVRDGWVIAARLEGKVTVEKREYGSSTFVLIEHEDPGLLDPRDSRTFIDGKKSHRLLRYYSLYMHLQPLTNKIAWLADLEKRDKARYDQLVKEPGKAFHFSHIAVPVKTGDLIGHIGTHNPFAARSDKLPAALPKVFDAKNHAVLHFEMFSKENLIQQFDPKRKLHASWTIADADKNALAEQADKYLAELKGFASYTGRFKALMEKMEKDDPAYKDPSLLCANLDAGLIDGLSCVISQHISEWQADWKPVIDRWFKGWELPKKHTKTATAVVKAFQWWNELIKSATTEYPNRTGLPNRPFFYHPIRLLNWLNGLDRVPNATLSDDPWTDLPGVGVSAAEGKKGDTTLMFAPETNRRRLENGMITLASGSQHEITAVETITEEVTVTEKGKTKSRTVTKAYRATVSPPLSEDVAKGQKLSLGRYGWHWEAKFAWDTKVE